MLIPYYDRMILREFPDSSYASCLRLHKKGAKAHSSALLWVGSSLRNIHPIYRGEYAHILFKEDEITKDEAREFTKIVGYGTN